MSFEFKLTNGWIRHHNHDISVGCKDVNESSKIRVPDFHALEGSSQFAIEGMRKISKNIKKLYTKFVTFILEHFHLISQFHYDNYSLTHLIFRLGLMK